MFGLVAFLVGVLVATQLVFWQANFSTSFLTFGRLRPLHTNAAIFAFVGNMMFAGIYYSTQRLLKARMASDGLSWFNFWGWQAIIVGAAITLPLGLTQFWQMRMIAAGGKPNWKALTLNAAGLVGSTLAALGAAAPPAYLEDVPRCATEALPEAARGVLEHNRHPLIVAQRAYETNSKTIQASDEMLQTATNLRR